eukprot:TRINITY_DN7792_c0_g1_i3.p1 TRINITY_DN7792_c0_g1~~TRINITY_DN7792_c0_g1_i3.p1  ORF type:complete len:353 (+),score=63.77 TRINITY_DN7792_c0_g1_i3:222-1280(+)
MEAGDVEPAGAMGSPAATSAEEACDVMPPATKSGDMPPATQDAPKPSRRGRAKFKTMGAVTNFSVQARDWTQEKPRKIWVKEKQGEGGCGCGGTTGSKWVEKEIDIFYAVERKQVDWVREILSGETNHEQATMLDPNGKGTPDMLLPKEEKRDGPEKEIYRMLIQACSQTILQYAENADWDKLSEFVPALSTKRDTTELLTGDVSRSPHGWTAVHLAAYSSDPESLLALQVLLSARADIDQLDNMLGYTALHFAVESASDKKVELLLRKNATRSNRDKLSATEFEKLKDGFRNKQERVTKRSAFELSKLLPDSVPTKQKIVEVLQHYENQKNVNAMHSELQAKAPRHGYPVA